MLPNQIAPLVAVPGPKGKRLGLAQSPTATWGTQAREASGTILERHINKRMDPYVKM